MTDLEEILKKRMEEYRTASSGNKLRLDVEIRQLQQIILMMEAR